MRFGRAAARGEGAGMSGLVQSAGRFRFLFFCLSLFWGLSIAGLVRAESPGDCWDDPEVGRFQCGYLAAMQEMATPRGPGDPQPETTLTDVLHNKIEIDVNPTAQTVAGTVTITAAVTTSPLSTFVVYLNPTGGAMNVTSVGGAATAFAVASSKITLSLDRTYLVGEQFTVIVNYSGAPTDGIFWGSHDPGTGPVPIVATLSEPYSARGWWPGKDVLNDKSTFEIWITVPSTYVAASNGVLQGVDPVAGGKSRYRWQTNYPMAAYLASLAIADYTIYNKTYTYLGDVMPMVFYMLPEYNTATNRGYCDTFVTQTQVFSDKYGQYPFVLEKGGMAHTPTLGGTYMEHLSLPSMPTFSTTWINAHELAHQWWGDNVTCETWSDIWLNEGFAAFSEAVWEQFKPGGSFAAYKTRMSNRTPSNPDSQVYVTNVNSVGAIFSSNSTYNKGAWVMHMLRHVLGDTVFFQSLLDYRAANQGTSATTAEFLASITATSGFDLAFFINQWVLTPGSPDYVWSWRPVDNHGLNYVQLYINQTQGSRGFGPFTMPIDVRITTGLGTKTVVLWTRSTQDAFTIPVDAPATLIEFDPDTWVLKHSVGTNAAPAYSPPCQGDANGDGILDGRDIQAFSLTATGILTGPAVWQRTDMNFSGRTDASDVPLFINALLGLSPCP